MAEKGREGRGEKRRREKTKRGERKRKEKRSRRQKVASTLLINYNDFSKVATTAKYHTPSNQPEADKGFEGDGVVAAT